MNWWSIVLLALAIPAAAYVAVSVLMRSAKRRADADVGGSGGDAEFRDQANYFGRESKGVRQNRGLGVLLATADELTFTPLVGKNGLRVQRSTIASASTARSFLGKAQGVDLLVVAWTNPDGSVDRAAWRTKSLDRWLAVLTTGAR